MPGGGVAAGETLAGLVSATSVRGGEGGGSWVAVFAG
jgi:hypothetical protein